MSSSHYFLPHKIHYQIFDAMGRVERVLVDNDAKENTGKSQSDNEGKSVEGIDQVLSYDFNVKGEEIEIGYDNDVDGIDDTREYLVLNANGDVYAKYINSDGKNTGVTHAVNDKNIVGIDSIELYTLNAKGEVIETNYNLDASLNNSMERVAYFERDSNGYTTKKFVNLDGKDSGTVQSINGKPISGIETIESYDYTSQGYLKRVEFDFNADKTVDQINYDVRSANGNLEAVYKNLDAKDNTGKVFELNGERFVGIDSRDERLNNSKGELIRYSEDTNGDGIIDKVNYDVRDVNGYLVGIHYDTDNDQTTGKTVTDENGRVLNGIERSEIFKVSPKGIVNQVEYDYGADGKVEEIAYEDKDVYGHFRGKYSDSDNNPETGSSYTLLDGRVVNGIDSTTKYEVNDRGHWIKAEFDYNADKVVDKAEYYIKTQEDRLEAVYWNWDGKDNTGYTHTINGEEIKGIDRYNKHVLNNRGEIIEAYLSFDGDTTFEQHNYDVRDNLGRLVELYEDRDNNSKTGFTYKTMDGRTVTGIEWRESRSFNEQNVLTQIRQDTDGDGETDKLINYQLSPNQQVLYVEFSDPMSNPTDVKITSIDFHETTTHHEDFTTSDWAERLKSVGGKLHLLNFGNDSTQDSLTLNKQAITDFVHSERFITIKGNEAKTVNLKDITVDSKQANTISHEGEEYAQYQFEHNGETYALNIDTDITVNFGEI